MVSAAAGDEGRWGIQLDGPVRVYPEAGTMRQVGGNYVFTGRVEWTVPSGKTKTLSGDLKVSRNGEI